MGHKTSNRCQCELCKHKRLDGQPTFFLMKLYPYAFVEETWFSMMFVLELEWRMEKLFRRQKHNLLAPGFVQPRIHVYYTDKK